MQRKAMWRAEKEKWKHTFYNKAFLTGDDSIIKVFLAFVVIIVFLIKWSNIQEADLQKQICWGKVDWPREVMMSWGWPSLYVFSIRKSNVKRNICTKPFLELLKSNLVCQPTCFCTSTLCGTWTLMFWLFEFRSQLFVLNRKEDKFW